MPKELGEASSGLSINSRNYHVLLGQFLVDSLCVGVLMAMTVLLSLVIGTAWEMKSGTTDVERQLLIASQQTRIEYSGGGLADLPLRRMATACR